MDALIKSVRKRCREKPGVTRGELYDEEYSILGGFLSCFARFILDENPPVVLIRCRDDVRQRLAATSSGIRVSDRMHWDTEGWSWTDVALDGSIPEESLLPLIDDSYLLACDSLYDHEKAQLALATRNLPPPELLAESIATCGLSRRRKEVESLARPALLLKTTSAAEAKLSLGQSRIGGRPDLPEGLEWPRFSDGKPLAFLAQINLSELPAAAKLKGLPKSGVLYFFSVFGWQVDGDADPQLPPGEYDYDWTRVLYHLGPDAAFQRQRTPKNVNAFKAAKVEFLPITTLPTDEQEPAVAGLKWKSDVREKYENLVSAFSGAYGHQLGYPPRNLLLGYADYEQGFVEKVADEDFQLLFQLSSDDQAGMMWGDGGFIYFWIRPQDLARRNFKKVYTDYQCG